MKSFRNYFYCTPSPIKKAYPKNNLYSLANFIKAIYRDNNTYKD